MDYAEFQRMVETGQAPRLSPPLYALWQLARGDWQGAHATVQAADDEDAARVHAHLHRVEGDTGNAAYWYRRAGHAAETGPLDAERERLVHEFLAREEPT